MCAQVFDFWRQNQLRIVLAQPMPFILERRLRRTTQLIMKTLHKPKIAPGIEGKNLTLGDLIAATYSACGERQAPKILQLAIESHLVRLKRPLG
jgi:hypothetical protein